jgi:hypothetical protein
MQCQTTKDNYCQDMILSKLRQRSLRGVPIAIGTTKQSHHPSQIMLTF